MEGLFYVGRVSNIVERDVGSGKFYTFRIPMPNSAIWCAVSVENIKNDDKIEKDKVYEIVLGNVKIKGRNIYATAKKATKL